MIYMIQLEIFWWTCRYFISENVVLDNLALKSDSKGPFSEKLLFSTFRGGRKFEVFFFLFFFFFLRSQFKVTRIFDFFVVLSVKFWFCLFAFVAQRFTRSKPCSVCAFVGLFVSVGEFWFCLCISILYYSEDTLVSPLKKKRRRRYSSVNDYFVFVGKDVFSIIFFLLLTWPMMNGRFDLKFCWLPSDLKFC